MIEKKTPAEIEKMAEVGQIVASALLKMEEVAKVGVYPSELDQVAREILIAAGATSPFLNYHPSWAPCPFPATVCISVNDAIVHGVPGREALQAGDVVSLDFGAVLNGWCGDSARTFIVGTPKSEADAQLVAATKEALDAGIAAAVIGNTLGDIGHAVAKVARKHRFGILEDHGGHGIGTQMHMDPFVPNEGRKGKGMKLTEGLVLAIEPMFIADGKGTYIEDEDGWTLRSVKGANAAHWEHTVAITAAGPRILTTI